MVSQCSEHSVSLRYFCAAFQRSIFTSSLKLITMKLQSLLPSIIYLLCQLNDFSSAPFFFWQQVWQRLGVTVNFTFNSPLMCNLKSHSEKNCVHVCGKKKCRKVTDVRWEKRQPLIILLSKRLWIALWRKHFPCCFWKTRDSFSCPLQIPSQIVKLSSVCKTSEPEILATKHSALYTHISELDHFALTRERLSWLSYM